MLYAKGSRPCSRNPETPSVVATSPVLLSSRCTQQTCVGSIRAEIQLCSFFMLTAPVDVASHLVSVAQSSRSRTRNLPEWSQEQPAPEQVASLEELAPPSLPHPHI